MADLTVVHSGTEFSFSMTVKDKGHFFKVTFEDGKESEIPIQSSAQIDSICPSAEGTAMWCLLENGEEQFYDAVKGSLLTPNELKQRKITVYK